MNEEPEIKELKRFIDDRGSIDQLYNSDLPFMVKRAYQISPLRGIKRGLHGHREEWKAFIVTKGIVKFVIVHMESEKVSTLTLSDKKSQILVVPNNYYNGFMSLEDGCDIIGFSSSTLEESLTDDFRLQWDFYGKDVWESANR